MKSLLIKKKYEFFSVSWLDKSCRDKEGNIGSCSTALWIVYMLLNLTATGLTPGILNHVTEGLLILNHCLKAC